MQLSKVFGKPLRCFVFAEVLVSVSILCRAEASGGDFVEKSTDTECKSSDALRPAPWRSRAFVSNDHGEALIEWLDAAAAQREKRIGVPIPKLTVLHIDAHADLNAPDDHAALHNSQPSSWADNATRRKIIADSADLANFQLTAVWAGLVKRIIWIKQGGGVSEHFKYKVDFNASIGSFAVRLVPLKQNSEQERDDTTGLSTHGSASGDEHGNTRDDMQQRVCFVHEIYEQSLRNRSVRSFVSKLVLDGPYVLDVDLDFFVWGDAIRGGPPGPGQPPWLDLYAASGFPAPECRQSVLSCRRWTDPGCPTWHRMQSAFDRVNKADELAATGTSSSGKQLTDSAQLECDTALAKWVVAVHERFAHSDVSSIAELHAAEWSLAVHQAHYPFIHKSPNRLNNQIALLEGLLQELTSHPPCVITVARSVDAFTWLCEAPELEERVMRLLWEIWSVHGFVKASGPQSSSSILAASYAQGTSSLGVLAASMVARAPCSLFTF